MADAKISALSAVTAPATTDVVPIVNAGVTKKVTIANLVNAVPAINKVTITAPATSATLTIPDGVTLNAGAGGTLGSNAFNSTAFAPLASPNTFTSAIQTVQGLTTTSPGWYAQITGDSVPRVRVGLNASDVASIGFGSGAGTRDLFFERAGVATGRLGAPDVDTAPVAQTLGVQNALAGGTSNVAGANWTFNGSQGKGTGAGGSIIFQVAPAGSTGTTVNPLSALLTIAPTGTTFSSNPIIISGNISAPTWTTNGVRIKGTPGTLTDTTAATGTTATAYTDVLGGNTIAATNAGVIFTNYFTQYNKDPIAGTNVTLTNKWALGADSMKIGTSNQLTVSTAGAVSAPGGVTVGTTIINSGIIQQASTGYIYWNARSVIRSTADGVVSLANNAETAFSRLQFGGTTASFGAFQTSGTAITAGLADGTAGGSFTASGTLSVTGASTLTGTVGIGTAPVANKALTIAAGTLTDTVNGLSFTATMPTTMTGQTIAADFEITSAGNSTQVNRGLYVNYKGGYTGSSFTLPISFDNAAAGTGASALTAGGAANYGFFGNVSGSTAGDNVGGGAGAAGGNKNIGLYGFAVGTKNSATNIGVVGQGLNAGSSSVQIGGFFGLMATAPTFGSAALMADNGATTSPVFVARVNGTAQFQITASGVPQLTGYTIAGLPTGVAGMYAYITDGDSGLAWGATAVNSGAGATKYLVWYNGSAWSVVGK